MQKIINNHLFLLLSGFTIILAGCHQEGCQGQKVFPRELWEERTPESQGVNDLILDSALSYFRDHSGGMGADEMVIIRNGFIIWKGPGIRNKHAICSCTKVFTSTVLGVLAADGKVNVNDLAVKYFPELAVGNNGQEVYSQIKLRDFATMTAGYNGISTNCWDLHLQGLHDESYACTQKYTIPGKPRFVAGTKFSYRDTDVHMLGYILTRVAGKSLDEVFAKRVASKIGMTDWDWSDYGYREGMFFNNPAGTPNNTGSTEMNEYQGGIWTIPEEFARLGLLYLNKGNWAGEQVLDSVFTQMAMSNQVPAELPALGIDLTGRYGFYWWTNGIKKDGTRPWPSAPPKTSTPVGAGGNYCFVIPEWEMVIVRMSPLRHDFGLGNINMAWEGFFKRLKDGISL